jgi:hypothetical protein
VPPAQLQAINDEPRLFMPLAFDIGSSMVPKLVMVAGVGLARRAGSDAGFETLADSVILVLGAPRSGTTWLAKILDSHPDVLYRHEPDETIRPRPDLDPRGQISAWIVQNGVRIATKRPFFRKSWMPAPLGLLRTGIACTVNGVERLLGSGHALTRVPVPDFISRAPRYGVRAAVKLVGWNGSAAARALPGSRLLFILRHPCGQIASTLNSASHRRRFEQGEDTHDADYDLRKTTAFAASRGMEPASFARLPLAAKYAWSWIAFNETVLDELEGLPNVRVVVYEDLCERPEAMARELLEFSGLRWNPQTARFIDQSTRHDGPAGYYAVFRSSAKAAYRWRSTMDPADQTAIRDVVRRSRLARYWPDLASATDQPRADRMSVGTPWHPDIPV